MKGSISVWFRVDYIPLEYGIMPIFYYGSKNPCNKFFDAANQGLIIEVGHSPIHLASKRIYFTIWANGCEFPSFCFDSRKQLNEGEWYHFVVVVGDDFNTGYLNGIEMNNRRYNFGNEDYSQFFEDAVVDEALWFGRGYWDAISDPLPKYFDGAIDDIRIFSKPLSSEEVSDLYNEGLNNIPPNKPFITGPKNGNAKEKYEYSFVTIDPDGDDVFYFIEWGDKEIENWIGPNKSGESINFNHIWNEQGDYIIRVKAKDIHGGESPWSDPLTITMPRVKLFNQIPRMLIWLFERFPFLQPYFS